MQPKTWTRWREAHSPLLIWMLENGDSRDQGMTSYIDLQIDLADVNKKKKAYQPAG